MAQQPDDSWVPRAQAALAKDPKHVDALRDLSSWHADRGDWEQSLALGERWLALAPDNLNALFNVSVARQVTGRFAEARDGFTRLYDADPTDWRVLAKLVQLGEALGDAPDRDRRLAQLRALRAGGSIPELNAAKSFVRDQFVVGGARVYASEHFELEGEWAVRYVFGVEKPPPGMLNRVSLGSYAKTTQYLRESGQIPANGRAWHLDGQAGPQHVTLGIYPHEPAYGQVKAWTIAALEGKLPAAASSGPAH